MSAWAWRLAANLTRYAITNLYSSLETVRVKHKTLSHSSVLRAYNLWWWQRFRCFCFILKTKFSKKFNFMTVIVTVVVGADGRKRTTSRSYLRIYRIRDQWVNHKVLRSNIISFARTEVIRWSHSKLPDSNVRRSAGKYQKSYKIYLYIDVRINYISCADDRQFAATTRLPTYQCIHIPHATAHFNQMKGFMTVSLPALFHCAKWLSFKRLRFRINCKSF